MESFLHLLKRVVENNYDYDDEELTSQDVAAIEKGKEQIAKGEYVELEDLKRDIFK